MDSGQTHPYLFTMGAPLYTFNAVNKDFSLNGKTIHVLKNLTLTLEQGQWTTIIGKSGSGKTTLLQLLGALDKPTSGDIFYKKINISRLSNRKLTLLRRKEFGFIFQSYHLLPELTAIENVVLPALGWFEDRSTAIKEAEHLLNELGLASRLHHRPQELSGGEQQRIAMARSLINHPKTILADEPTGNLDPASAHQVIENLLEAKKKLGLSIIMVTHDQNLAQQSDKILNLTDLNS